MNTDFYLEIFDRVNEMLDSFDALDALVGTKPEKKKDDDLYFDLGIYKSHNEVSI